MADYTIIGDNGPDGVKIGVATSSKVGFHGTTPISQRAGSWQATSLVATASSADVTSDLKACIIEMQNTLIAYGMMKGGV